MSNTRLVFASGYTEAILFGTGQVLQGKGKGIYAYSLDEASGELTEVAVTPDVRNPSYMAFDPSGKFMYAVNEYKEYEGMESGAVSAFRLEGDSGKVTFLNQKASHGTDPCHLIVDKTGKNVLVANFASGSVSVLPINKDGSLQEASCVIQHEGTSIDPDRQKGPHAHAVELSRDNRYAFVPELGGDTVQIYELDAENGKLTPNPNQPSIAMQPGAGPRQVVMHPTKDYAYLINELNNTMTAYKYDPTKGTLGEINTLSTLPAEGFDKHTSCAEVQISPDGKFLYGSNRGHNSLAIYRIDDNDGSVSLVGHESTRGEIPRNFEIDDDGMFVAVANQDTGNIVMFRRNAEDGSLSFTGNEITDAGTPVCVRFL